MLNNYQRYIEDRRNEILFTKPKITNNVAHLYFYKLNTKSLELVRVDYIKKLKKAKDIDKVIKEQGYGLIPAFKLYNKGKGEFLVKINPENKYVIMTYIRETYTNPMNYRKSYKIFRYYYLWNGNSLNLHKRQYN